MSSRFWAGLVGEVRRLVSPLRVLGQEAGQASDSEACACPQGLPASSAGAQGGVTLPQSSAILIEAARALRTPLTLISGYIEWMRSGQLEDRESVVHGLAIMERHSRRMVGLLNDLEDLGKLLSGAQSLHLEALDLRHCLGDSLEGLEQFFREAGLEVQVHWDADLQPLVRGDRVCWNLIFVPLLGLLSEGAQGSSRRLLVAGHQRDDRLLLELSADAGGCCPTATKAPQLEALKTDPRQSLSLQLIGLALQLQGGRLEHCQSQQGELCLRLSVAARQPAEG